MEGVAKNFIESILGTPRELCKIVIIIQDCKRIFCDNNLEVNILHIYSEGNRVSIYLSKRIIVIL